MNKNVLQTFNCTKILYLICGYSRISSASKKISNKQKIYFTILLLLTCYSLYLTIAYQMWRGYYDSLWNLLGFLNANIFYYATYFTVYITRLKLPCLSQIAVENGEPPKNWNITQNIFIIPIIGYLISWVSLDLIHIFPGFRLFVPWFDLHALYFSFSVVSYCYFVWLHLATLSCYLFVSICSTQFKSKQFDGFESNPLRSICKILTIFQDLNMIFDVFKTVFLVDVGLAYWHLCSGLMTFAVYKFINSFFSFWIILSILVVIVIVECYNCFLNQVCIKIILQGKRGGGKHFDGV